MASNITSLPRFNDLPKELRLMIWEYALPGPNLISIETATSSEGNIFAAAKSTLPIPALLHTNPEARSVALRQYEPAFEANLGGKCIYIDPSTDGVVFTSLGSMILFCGVNRVKSWLTLDTGEPDTVLISKRLRLLGLETSCIFPFVTARLLRYFGRPEHVVSIDDTESRYRWCFFLAVMTIEFGKGPYFPYRHMFNFEETKQFLEDFDKPMPFIGPLTLEDTNANSIT